MKMTNAFPKILTVAAAVAFLAVAPMNPQKLLEQFLRPNALASLSGQQQAG